MPAVLVSASVTNSVVTFYKLYSKNLFVVQYLRRTFEIRYEVHENALSMVLPFRTSEEASISARVTLSPVLGQIAKLDFVGKILARR